MKLISEFLMDTWDEVCFVFSTREEMKSLQEAFQKQLNEAAEKAEKQQATVSLCPFSNFWVLSFCLFKIPSNIETLSSSHVKTKS